MNKKSTFILFIVFMIFSFLTCGCGDNSGNDGNYQIYYPWAIAQNEAGEENRAPAPVPTPTVDPTVEPTPTPTVDPTVEPATLELSQSTFNMEVDETDNIVVSLNGNPVENAEFIVANDSVATVAADGTITAVGTGTTTVTVKVDGAEDATFTITVTEPVIPDLVLSKNSFEIAFGGNTDNVTVTLDGEDVTQSQGLTYDVADPDIVTVNGGEIKTSSVAYSERMETTVTVHLDGANDATFTVVVTANISGVTQTKGFNDWSGLLDDLYAIGQVSSNDKTQLTELKVPAVYKNTSGQLYKITSFDSESFKDCSNLMSVTIPGTVREINASTFKDCNKLESITFMGDGLNQINSYAFDGCTALKSIDIPDTVTNINYYAFHGCTSLKTVHLPDNNSFTQIPEIFNGCTALKEIIIPKNVTQIGWQAFYNCTSLETVTFMPTENGTYKCWQIGGHAFYNCTSLNITLPKSVTDVGWEAFVNVQSVTYQN